MFVDHFSKYAEAKGLDNQRAETEAREFVEKLVLRHHVPSQLLSDRGLNSASKLMKQLRRFQGIRKTQTGLHHPTCNAAVKRLNLTVRGLLSHYVGKDRKDWHAWLPYALFPYNPAFHSRSNKTPFFLLHGRDPVFPGVVMEEFKRTDYATVDI